MKIAVITPSRLAVNPASPRGALYIERAIGSVRRQTVAKEHAIKIYVGVDPVTPEGAIDVVDDHADGWAIGNGNQASAVNAAVEDALDDSPDFLSFLEDDDHYHPQKLEYQLAALAQGFDFVSCSQREVTPDGDYVRVNDFPTMSGWILRAELWNKVGPMDETFKWHLDNEWLGRLQKTGAKRLHFAEHSADRPGRPWLTNVGQFSKVAMTDGLLEPLVTRTVNPGGGMARIATDPAAAAESQREHMRLWEKNGARIPW